MARQTINTGSGGDTVKSGFDKSEANFVDLYSGAGAPTTIAHSNKLANYTLALADAGTVVEMNVGAANKLTVPQNSSVAFPIGTVLEVCQIGLGITTIEAGTGATVRNAGELRAQYSSATLRKRATNEWIVSGDML